MGRDDNRQMIKLQYRTPSQRRASIQAIKKKVGPKKEVIVPRILTPYQKLVREVFKDLWRVQ
jgi:hypothetical protein